MLPPMMKNGIPLVYRNLIISERLLKEHSRGFRKTKVWKSAPYCYRPKALSGHEIVETRLLAWQKTFE